MAYQHQGRYKKSVEEKMREKVLMNAKWGSTISLSRLHSSPLTYHWSILLCPCGIAYWSLACDPNHWDDDDGDYLVLVMDAGTSSQ